jgi:isoquinoline 1-oxidoreductase alpha subunit
MRYSILVNGKRRSVDAAPNTPLLWVLRDDLQLTGTKYGCGIALCGACTVHLKGVPARGTWLSTAETARLTPQLGAPPGNSPSNALRPR